MVAVHTIGWRPAHSRPFAALPLTLVMSSVGTPQSVATKAQEYAPAELKPIVGDLQQTEHGYQFSGTNIPVGVAAIPIPDKGSYNRGTS